MIGTEGLLRRSFGSIGNKMLAALVAVAVLPAVTVAIYAMERGANDLADQGLELLLEAATRDADQTGAILASIENDMLEAARSVKTGLNDLLLPPSGPILERTYHEMRALDTALGQLEDRLRSMVELRSPCITAFFRIRSKLLVPTHQPPGLTLLRVDRSPQGIQAYRALHLDFSVEKARIRSIGQRLDMRIDQAHMEALRNSSGRPVRRTTMASKDPSDDCLEIFSTEFRNSAGHTVGGLMVAISWRELLRTLLPDLPEQELEYGISVYHSDLRPLLGSSLTQRVDIPQHLQTSASKGEVGAALTADGTIVSYAPFQPIPEDASRFYILAFRRLATDVTRSVAKLRVVFALILVAALLLTLGLGTYVSRRLTRPLRLVRDGARRIGRGDLEQRLQVKTGDEVEELAEEFNSMATRLQGLYDGMDQTITKRTAQLQTALDDLRVAHQQIVASEARYSDIVENAYDMIQVTDREGMVLSANRRQAEVFGVPLDQIKGANFFDWVAADDKDITRQAFAAVLGGESLRAFVSTLALDDGHRSVAVEISATPVDRDGRTVGVRAILRDISERKAIEAQLIKAERLSSVGALAAGVAHEINNPLGIIAMFAQRVLEKARKGTVDVGKLETIVEQSRRVGNITKGLLDFSRAAPTDHRPFALAQVIRDSVALVKQRARRNAIALDMRVGELPEVFGNPQQIGQVLLNLLLNAIQAIEAKGRVQIRGEHVEVSRLPGKGPAVRVSVSDSGPGIAADVLPRLFEPFFTTKAAGQGTGLGLSVSYGILKEHHGLLWANNQSEGGARFSFDLPVPRMTIEE